MALEEILKEARGFAIVDEVLQEYNGPNGHTLNPLDLYFEKLDPELLKETEIQENVRNYGNLHSSEKNSKFVNEFYNPKRERAVTVVQGDLDSAISYLDRDDSLTGLLLKYNPVSDLGNIADTHGSAREAVEFLNSREGIEGKIKKRIEGKIARLAELGLEDYVLRAAASLYENNSQELAEQIIGDARREIGAFANAIKEDISGAQDYLKKIYDSGDDNEKEKMAAELVLQIDATRKVKEKDSNE